MRVKGVFCSKTYLCLISFVFIVGLSLNDGRKKSNGTSSSDAVDATLGLEGISSSQTSL